MLRIVMWRDDDIRAIRLQGSYQNIRPERSRSFQELGQMMNPVGIRRP